MPFLCLFQLVVLSIGIYRITPQRAACRYKWGWPFSWKWPYGAIPACRYKPRYAFRLNFCPFSYTSFIIQIWVIITQFHFKSIVSKLKFIWASLLIQKFYFNHLNPSNFKFLLQYLFERRKFYSLTYTGMPVYPGVYRHMVNLTLYRHAALCGVIRYNSNEIR